MSDDAVAAVAASSGPTLQQMRESVRQAVSQSLANGQAHQQQSAMASVHVDDDTIEAIDMLLRTAPKNARLHHVKLERKIRLYTPNDNFEFKVSPGIDVLPQGKWIRVRGPIVQNSGRDWVLAVFDKVSPPNTAAAATDDWFKIQEFYVLVSNDKGRLNMTKPTIELPFVEASDCIFSLEDYVAKAVMPTEVKSYKIDPLGADRQKRTPKTSAKDDTSDDDSDSDDGDEEDADEEEVIVSPAKSHKRHAAKLKLKKSGGDDRADSVGCFGRLLGLSAK